MDYLDEQRALLRQRRLERLIARARRRMLRRKAKSESIWTAHIHKTGHQPTLWHARYQRAVVLEDEAYILMNWLGVLAGQTEAPPTGEATAPLSPPSAPEGPSKTLAVWREGQYLAVSWTCQDHARRQALLASFKQTFPEDRVFQPATHSWCLAQRWIHVLRDWAHRHFSPDEQDWQPGL